MVTFDWGTNEVKSQRDNMKGDAKTLAMGGKTALESASNMVKGVAPKAGKKSQMPC